MICGAVIGNASVLVVMEELVLGGVEGEGAVGISGENFIDCLG